MMSYKRGGSTPLATGAAAVVAVGVAAREVGRGHERVTLIGAAVLRQRVHALLAGGLPGVCQGTVAVGVPCHQVHAVLGSNNNKDRLSQSESGRRFSII